MGDRLLTTQKSGPSAWLEDFDRDLRCPDNAVSIGAILNLGPKMKKWAQEQISSDSVSSHDVPFVNSILLRLADAFQSGSSLTRLFVLKFFLLQVSKIQGREFEKSLEVVMGNEKDPRCDEMKLLDVFQSKESEGTQGRREWYSVSPGLLHPCHLLNPGVLLRRIKNVYQEPDVSARCLSIRMIGCLAWLASDDAEAFHIVLKSLNSNHASEVQAALSASSFLVVSSPQFAATVLPTILQLASDPCSSLDQRLRAIWLLSSCGSLSSLAFAAFEVGETLISDPSNLEAPEANLLALSLTLLALRCEPLLAAQAGLLLTLLTKDFRDSVRSTGLLCLNRLADVAPRGSKTDPHDLLVVADLAADEELPHGIRSLAVQVLLKFCRRGDVVLVLKSSNPFMEIMTKVSMDPDSLLFLPAASLCVHLLEAMDEAAEEGLGLYHTEAGAMEVDKESSGELGGEGRANLCAVLCEKLVSLCEKPGDNPRGEVGFVLSLLRKLLRKDRTLYPLALNVTMSLGGARRWQGMGKPRVQIDILVMLWSFVLAGCREQGMGGSEVRHLVERNVGEMDSSLLSFLYATLKLNL